MALTNDQITAGVNAALQRVYPGIENGEENALFEGMMTLMLFQGKRLTAEAEAEIAQHAGDEAMGQVNARIQERRQAAAAVAADYLAYIASLAQGG